MLSQIIFFTAVALLVVLLLRRAKMGKNPDKVTQIIMQVGIWCAGVINSIINFFGQWRSESKNRPGVNNRSLRDIGSTNAGHHFWKEELLPDKLELNTDFEEGEALFRAGKFQEAEQYYLKAATSSPGDSKIYARLGLIYLQTKNYSDAIEALKVAVKLDKYNPSRHYNLALAYMNNSDIQKAIASVREAITLDPVTQKYRQLLEQLLNG